MRRLGREALVAESMSVLADSAGASMAEIASEIGVGRTTLYRHFGDRETLVAEVARQGARLFVDAFLSARPDVGPGLECVERVCAQLFTVPDVLTLMFADSPIITDDVFAEVEGARHADSAANREPAVSRVSGEPHGGDRAAREGDPLEAIIRRGQDDGSIAPEVPVEWAAMYVFLTIGSGHLFELSTRSQPREVGARPEALDLTTRAIRKTLSAS
ncbi:hypothetical protein GCM10009813_19080 [Brevibacterium marinum]